MKILPLFPTRSVSYVVQIRQWNIFRKYFNYTNRSPVWSQAPARHPSSQYRHMDGSLTLPVIHSMQQYNQVSSIISSQSIPLFPVAHVTLRYFPSCRRHFHPPTGTTLLYAYPVFVLCDGSEWIKRWHDVVSWRGRATYAEDLQQKQPRFIHFVT